MTTPKLDDGTRIHLRATLEQVNIRSRPRFARYRNGMTVAEHLDFGKDGAAGLLKDHRAGYISLSPPPDLDNMEEELHVIDGVSRPCQRHRMNVKWPDGKAEFWYYARTRSLDYAERDYVRAPSTYGQLRVRGRRVLDVGGHIGLFTLTAQALGAAATAGVEADPDTAALYHANTGAKVYQGAVGTGRDVETEFYRLTCNCAASSAMIKRRNATKITVPTIDIKEIYQDFQPEVLKIDIEGAEYGLLLDNEMPDSVRQVAVELTMSPAPDPARIRQLDELFSEWKCLRDPKWEGGYLPNTFGVWSR